MGLQESDGDKHQDEEHKHDQQDPKWCRRSTILHSKPNGNVDFKNDTIRHSWPSESTIKKKTRQLK